MYDSTPGLTASILSVAACGLMPVGRLVTLLGQVEPLLCLGVAGGHGGGSFLLALGWSVRQLIEDSLGWTSPAG